MADNFNASLVISTSDAVNNVRNLDSASKDLDKTLAHLHTTMGNSQGDIDKVAKSLKVFTDTQRQANKDQKERNNTLISGARLEREQIVNKDKSTQATQRQAQQEAKLAGIRARNGRDSASGLGNATRRNAESDARISAQGAMTQARLATELERRTAAEQRTAAAVAQRSGAESRAEMSTMRLGQAQERANNSNLALNDSLSNSRYLLYDVAQTYAVLSAALMAIPIATTAVAASYEKDFAQVIRTTGVAGSEANALFQELKNMGTQIPLSFGALSNIASIAGQLGIAKDEIASFTDSVAKFSAASNVGISEAATAFGRLEQSFNADGNIPDFYNKVGSAIAKVGVESAASETEIVAVSNQISAAGAQFGFTADEIVGMSGALASVRIRPELARGAFQRILLQLSRAADEGGDSFNKFGKYTGLAGDAAVNLFKTDPSAFFNKYINGIKGTIDSGKSVSSVLDDIGAKNVFDKQFILGLANGQQVYNKALSDSSKAFEEGTFLNSSTQGIFETFAATVQKLGTAFQNLGQSLGAGGLQILKPLADTFLNVTSAMNNLLEKAPGFKVLINALLAIGAVTGVFLAFKAAQAFVLAGLVGLQQVMGRTAIAGALSLRGNISELAKTMLMAKGATAAMAQGLLTGKTAMQQMAMATTATTASLARFATVSSVTGVGVAATTTRLMSARLAMGAFGASMLGLVGGPVGAIVLGLVAVATSLVSVQEEARQAGEAIATALKSGADAGNSAAAQQLINRKVGANDGASFFGDAGKNASEIARQSGVAFEKVVAGAAGGAAGMKQFRAELERIAKLDQGNKFKSLDDFLSNPIPGTKAANLQFLNKAVMAMNGSTVQSVKDQEEAAKATDKLAVAEGRAAPSAENLDVALDGVGDSADSAANKIQKAVDALFGIVDAEVATQEALGKLGAGLQDSADFGTSTDGGRANLGNFRDTLRAAAEEQAQLAESGKQSFSQASANYSQFIDGLLQELSAKGVNVAQVQSLAEQAKSVFGTTFASGEQPKIQPVVDSGAAVTSATQARADIQSVLDIVAPTVKINGDATPAQNEVLKLASNLSTITGWPYNVVVDALTHPATEKGQELAALITSITNQTYTAPIGADTSAAVTNVRNFADYASRQLASIQSSYNQVAASAPTLAKYGMGAFKGVTGVQAPAGIRAPSSVPVAQVAAPSQVAPTIPSPNFGALNNGYKDAAKAAKGAGDAGKQAGKDMANGIDDATEAANDYASRLKTGLQSAFDKQYGMQKASDEYYKTLNSITKKREEESAQLDDLIAKQKELNTSREGDLVNARKAGTEKAISQKYGENDRAMDYAQQEEEALLAAAAKQKDIDANNKTASSLRAGIDDFSSNSDAAIANREALRDLESKMLDMVSAYAATGASQEQVRAYAQRLTAQFQTDANQAYQNRVQIDKLVGDMWRYIDVVNRVPQVKTTAVTANTNGTVGAIDAVGSALNGLRDREVTVKVRGGMVYDNNNTSDGQPIYRVIDRDGNRTNVKLFNRGGLVDGYANGGLIPGKSPSDPSVDNLMASVDGKGMVKVRSGEFIVQQPAVDYWGLDFFKNLNNMKMPAFNAGGSVGGGAGGGSNAGGAVLVELTAENIQAIIRAGERPVTLYAGVEQIASSANEGNKILASKGVSN